MTDQRHPTDTLHSPRLQLRWAPAAANTLGYPWECHYELVLPLGEHDIRREIYDDEGELTGKVCELSVALKPPTRRGGGGTPCSAQNGSRHYDEPYRDGAHALWDAKALGGLPIYVIASDGMAFKMPNV